MNAIEIENHISAALAPNRAVVRSIDHGECFGIRIMSPAGEALLELESIPRESVTTMQQLLILIQQLKGQLE